MLDLHIEDYGGGYRPTATGKIGGRDFVFRAMSGVWMFGVAKEGAPSVWWHSPDADFTFQTSGTQEYVAFHDESLPYFIEGLEKYLVAIGLNSQDRSEMLSEAERQAKKLFLDVNAPSG